jgi:hypothetical protein
MVSQLRHPSERRQRRQGVVPVPINRDSLCGWRRLRDHDGRMVLADRSVVHLAPTMDGRSVSRLCRFYCCSLLQVTEGGCTHLSGRVVDRPRFVIPANTAAEITITSIITSTQNRLSQKQFENYIPKKSCPCFTCASSLSSSPRPSNHPNRQQRHHPKHHRPHLRARPPRRARRHVRHPVGATLCVDHAGRVG